MGRLTLAFRSFFGILFGGALPAGVAEALGLIRKPQAPVKPARAETPARVSDGALQILGILQRDARLIDFLMEDISGYTDDQVGAAVRNLHEQCRGALQRYFRLAPVIDGVEGSYTKLDEPGDPARVKLLGLVPADGRVAGGVLRHRGWRAEKVTLPALPARQDPAILAPAELEIE